MAAAVGLHRGPLRPRRQPRRRRMPRCREPAAPGDGRQQPVFQPTIRRSASSATAACAPARRSRAPSRSPSRAAASRAASSPAWTRASSPRNASPAAPASSPARPARWPRRRSIEIGAPEHSKITTCAYCGVGCAFKAEMRGEEVVRMVPWKDGKANRGHSCVKGRFAYGYATHRDRILTPMVRDRITDPWRETTWEEAIGRVASRVPPHPGRARPRRGRRHHLVALHQRGGLPRAEADPPGLRREQRRHLRPGLPLADRLRAEGHLRRERRHPGLRQRRGLPTSCWSSAPTRPTATRSSPAA